MKEYNIIFVDDEKNLIETIINAIKGKISLVDGYNISFRVLDNKDDIEKLPTLPADIVLFDCAMGSAAIDFGSIDSNTFGFDLMKSFRKNNLRAKVIFYSGGFEVKGSQCYDFTNEEMLQLINDIHVYKMIPKDASLLARAIMEAISELDMIIMSMQDLREDYYGEGVVVIDDKEYSLDFLINELKMGSKLGDKFRKNVISTVVTYMMKFNGDCD